MSKLKYRDISIKTSYARIISAVYFGLLAVIFTLISNAILLRLDIIELIPLFTRIPLAMISTGLVAGLFGPKIIQAPNPFSRKVFYLGFLMALCALLLYDFGFIMAYVIDNLDLFNPVHPEVFVKLYISLLVHSFILIGFYLALLTGIAAIYLRARIIYYIYESFDD